MRDRQGTVIPKHAQRPVWERVSGGGRGGGEGGVPLFVGNSIEFAEPL